MGVSRLWDLLAPCGRRISLDTLARKRLAVDASIWLIQFIKAMRDQQGDMIQNAPILGLFRRLCKLLILHIYPVLVFDGATPALKQRTVARRRAFRQRQEASLRRTAERILLNQVKGRHLLHGLVGEALINTAQAVDSADTVNDGAGLADQFAEHDEALDASGR